MGSAPTVVVRELLVYQLCFWVLCVAGFAAFFAFAAEVMLEVIVGYHRPSPQ